jgi:hypothetical protein
MKIGFTGTQIGLTLHQQGEVKRILVEVWSKLLPEETIEFHHGDCIGSDAQAGSIASLLGCIIHVHPPIDARKRAYAKGNVTYAPKEYIERNHNIVDLCNLLIATPRSKDEEIRSGTWATIRYARKRNIPIILITPNGA